jgi:OOP family OmpA-OmpF porin
MIADYVAEGALKAGYLEDKGIPASQLIPQGFGKTHFVATNSTAEGRAENRRVELLPEQ